MPICACGCGESPKHGTYLPGHDAKLRKMIEEKVGGLAKLTAIVELSEAFVNNRVGQEAFCSRMKEIFLK